MNEKKKSNPQILFEDEEILVVDKPSGLISTRDISVKEKTLQDWIEKKYPQAGVAHRLDKETSGALIIAKNPKALESLRSQFKNRKVKKTYLALVHGKIFPTAGNINFPIGRLPWNKERFGILPSGRPSKTSFKLISAYQFTNLKPPSYYSLLELYPKTGRTHQIRVHLKSIGHPIVSDEFYAGRKTSRKDRLWCSRLFLHASKVAFKHPVTGRVISIKSALPNELKKVLKLLKSE